MPIGHHLEADAMTRNQRRQVRKALESGKHIRCHSPEELAEVQLALHGMAVHVMILHDDGCSPEACRCRPEFVLERLTPEGYLEGQAAQKKWAKETLS